MQRLLQVGLAVVTLVAVGILARPSDPQVPPPFEIERETPLPRPTGTPAEPTPGPTGGAPEPDEVDSTEPGEEPWRSGEMRLVLHALEPQTLEPLGGPVGITLEGRAGVLADVSPDGRYVALAHGVGAEGGFADLWLYDMARLDDPIGGPGRAVDVPAGVAGIWFSADASHLVWVSYGDDGVLHLAGVELGGDGRVVGRLQGLALPEDFAPAGLGPLAGARVGLHGYVVAPRGAGPGPGTRGPESGPVRLVAADLATGELAMDLTLPTADGGAPLEGALDVRHLRAGVAWDADRDRAYVAHADRDDVLVVDLAAGEVATTVRGEVEGAPATGEGGEELAGDPEASRWRDATLSGDGTRLYVHGRASAPLRADDDMPEVQEAELPLLVVDLETGTMTRRSGATGRLLAAADGGEHVALVTGETVPDAPQMLRLHGGDTLEARWERPVAHASDAWFAPGGERLHVFSSEDFVAGQSGARLEALDLRDGSVLRTVEYGGGYWFADLEAGVVVEVHDR